jgi:hypothetical protein
MNHWKWSKGEPYYKSIRELKERRQAKEPKEIKENNHDIEYDSPQNAINQSLAEDSFFNQDLTNSMFSLNKNSNREDIDNKMADREMITQRGVNPFLQTSYVNDIVTRDMFLKPLNTTQGRTNNLEDDSTNS